MINYIRKNYVNLLITLPVLVYLYYFDQSFKILSINLDLRTSLFLIFLILLFDKNIKTYWSFLKNLFFFSIFIFIQSYLMVSEIDFNFSNNHYLKIFIIILFLSILISYSNLIYTKIYKILYLFIVTFPVIYLFSRLYCYFLVNDSFDIIQYIDFINLKFGELRILLAGSGKYYNAPILFKEQSHFNMIATFTVFFLLKLFQKIKFNMILYFASAFYFWIIYINFSSTLLFGYSFSLILLIISDLKNIKKYSVFYIMASLIFISLNLIKDVKINNSIKDLESIISNFDKSAITLEGAVEKNQYLSLEIKSLSSEVYLFNLKVSIIALKNKITGYGINSYSEVHEKFRTLVPNKLKGSNWLNTTNGSNVMIKSIAEFGFISILLGLLFLYLILYGKISHQKKIIIISGFITIVTVRGAGYVSGGFLIFFAIFITEFLKKLNITI